jgi:micrococcal nuclease
MISPGRRRVRRFLAAVLLAVAIVAAAVGSLRRQPAPDRERPRRGLVTFVYDGDTIEVSGTGKVRIIGIDALDAHNEERLAGQAAALGMRPERVAHWAEQAADFARDALLRQQVDLHRGPERRDHYGRALAYVHLPPKDPGRPGADFGLEQLRLGLAEAYRSAEHPRRELYLAAEHEARLARRGLWQDARDGP